MSRPKVVVAKIGTSSITDEQGEITHAAIAKLCANYIDNIKAYTHQARRRATGSSW